MSNNERHETIKTIKQAAALASKHGTNLFNESQNERVALLSIAIMFSSLGSASGCSLHDLMGLLMEVHKKTLDLREKYEDNE